MTQTTMHLVNSLASLGDELSRIGKALISVSTKIQRLSGPKVVSVTKKTDPEMFTKEFKETVRRSLEDIKKGRIIAYEQVRRDLGL